MTSSPPGDGSENFILLQQWAEEFLEAANTLLATWTNHQSMHDHLLPIAHLLGHSIELSLKGFISIGQIGSKKRVPRLHDLMSLLDLVLKLGSAPSVSPVQRAQVEALNFVHDNPYLARYPKKDKFSIQDMNATAETADFLCNALDNLARRQNPNDPAVRIRLGAAP